VEFNAVFRPLYGLPPLERAPRWFLSDIFFEALAEWGDARLPVSISERVIAFMRREPSRAIYSYLMETPEDVRRASVRKFTDGSKALRQRIEARRTQHADESMSMRWKIQSALLMINEIDLLLSFAAKAGVPWKTVADIGRENALRIMDDMPTFHIEREIALRLEAAQNRPVAPNDFRDMQTFCAVLCYADVVVAENMFANLARQAKLDRKYNTEVLTNLLALNDAPQRASA
jgi:hypothetical protein